MRYFLDSADNLDMEIAMKVGFAGITANPTLLYSCHKAPDQYMAEAISHNAPFISLEVIGDNYEQLYEQANSILNKWPGAVLKFNFSLDALKLISELEKHGHPCAITLVFSLEQVMAAANVDCSYIFFFIGRNEQIGCDGLNELSKAQSALREGGYNSKLVAASLRNRLQLRGAIDIGVFAAAIPMKLFLDSLDHPLTTEGTKKFVSDYNKLHSKEELVQDT